MAPFGRRSVPGERSVGGVLNQEGVLNRTLRAQVSAVNPENGYVLITYESMPSGGKFVTVPPLWMSFPDSSAGGPAWGRYMPQQSDLVLVSSDYDDSPHIVGYDIVAGKANVADGRVGWPQLNDQYKAGRESDDSKRAKFAQFVPLNPGEFDFMSSGGAYIYGNNKGRLYLAGGSVSVALVKNDLRINQRAQVWNHIADDCDIRFGQVRRLDTSDQIEKALTNSETDKEFNVTLKKSVPGGTATNIASLVMGNVRDDQGNEMKTAAANDPLRFSYKAYTAAGEEALHMAIDNIGNWEVSAPNADNGVVFDFTNSNWKATFKDVEWNMTSTYTINGSNDTLFKLTDSVLEIGASPTDWVALASLVKQELSNLRSSLNSFIQTYNTHTHTVSTTGTAAAQTGNAAPTLSLATQASPVGDVKSSFVKSK